MVLLQEPGNPLHPQPVSFQTGQTASGPERRCRGACQNLLQSTQNRRASGSDSGRSRSPEPPSVLLRLAEISGQLAVLSVRQQNPLRPAPLRGGRSSPDHSADRTGPGCNPAVRRADCEGIPGFFQRLPFPDFVPVVERFLFVHPAALREQGRCSLAHGAVPAVSKRPHRPMPGNAASVVWRQRHFSGGWPQGVSPPVGTAGRSAAADSGQRLLQRKRNRPGSSTGLGFCPRRKPDRHRFTAACPGDPAQ